MKLPRASGILLHPTSLPGEFGIGDLGPAAFGFVHFLADAKQTYWQVLPLGPTGYGDSPYQCFSAFAGNTLLVSPEKLIEDGLLDPGSMQRKPAFAADKVDYGGVYEWKRKILSEAFSTLRRTGDVGLNGRFDAFCSENAWWLNDYAAYQAIKAANGQKAWFEWEDGLKLRDPVALTREGERLQEAMQAEKFYQFLFFRQWEELKAYATGKGVKIIGDAPIFVALDSADVWCNQGKFKLNEDGSPKVVAGVPPDYFSKTGQLWGNPIYNWDAMREDGFNWWIARIAYTLRTVDIVRLDHFRGFAAAWEVPGGDEIAENGEWVDVPGWELFSSMKKALGELPVFAEDLGVITADVKQMLEEFEFPGMRILQFAFGGDARNHDLPHNYVRNCVAYTGTHDNDTAVGWWRSRAGSGSTRDTAAIGREREHCIKYLHTKGDEINWDLIRAVWASIADTAIAPAQDLLGVGTEGRMNLPASESGNWQWRLKDGALDESLAARLRDITELYGRGNDQ